MKSNIKLLLSCILLYACNNSSPITSPDSEELTTEDTVSIKAVISGETDAFLKRDSLKLLRYYCNDSITKSAWNNPNGSFTVLNGLGAIKENFTNAFRSHPEPIYLPVIDRSNWKFRKFSKHWIWAEFTQEIKTLDGKTYTGQELRLLKKEKSNWKIAVMYALSNHGVTQ